MTKSDKDYLVEVYDLLSTGRVHQARWMLAQLLGIIDSDFGPVMPIEPETA